MVAINTIVTAHAAEVEAAGGWGAEATCYFNVGFHGWSLIMMLTGSLTCDEFQSIASAQRYKNLLMLLLVADAQLQSILIVVIPNTPH
jgi:hypothetical protein